MTPAYCSAVSAPSRRVVVVGASLAGLRAAEVLRDNGFDGELTLIGDEPDEPYDRPPLSKAVLSGWLTTDQIWLPQSRDLDARWLLGTRAAGLDVPRREVLLADGRRIGFDRMLMATGTRARPWPQQVENSLTGVHVLRGRDDAHRLRAELAAGPRRVLVIGGGFIGCEVASSCKELGLSVTLIQRSGAPLISAVGSVVGGFVAEQMREAGVDLRLHTTATRLEGDQSGRLCRATLSDGHVLEVDVAVVALGSIRNIEWLDGAGLAADHRGVVCDAACRVFDAEGVITDDLFAAGDIARWPHPLYTGELISIEHWSNAVDQAAIAAHNMLCSPAARRAHQSLPAFWSDQFGLNIKSIGLPNLADQVVIAQGTLDARCFVAAYGRHGRLVGAVAINSPRVLDGYASLIEARTSFPPVLNAPDGPPQPHVVEAGFPEYS
ncbi:FAD-dependent oxidoreductase [Pseudonocardia sp. C8]|uniref:NAD(P)/FAD-dependent oxidoreductase n=1 Tax=Pseudonocardia sp. C8 TaxID=2762759 RepID=UPI0016430FFA|nr:FAD-dependent oxidoreductase [Pseudonocardia sp. C8]MBC3189501.1 FAD-dependent oxidoreductase [Pseudonocardia sp. C8]